MLAGMAAVIVTPEFIDLDAPAISRALLRHIVLHADRIGVDAQGHEILRFEFAAAPWLVDKLASLGAAAEDLEDDDPAEDDDGA